MRSRAGWLGRRHLGTGADRTTFRTLHTASLTTPALRAGLTAASAEKAVRHLRSLLGAPAIALTDTTDLLAWDGRFGHHADQTGALARQVVADGATTVRHRDAIPCADAGCGLRAVIVTPLTVEEKVVGTLQVFAGSASAGLVRAADEVARWVSGQLELAELDASRTRLMEAEVRALRAQISPHFIYNALTAIASFVRTDPELARELILEFAEFTRYSFRAHGEFTTLAEELRSIDRYLTIERARFGERLQVRLQIAPEVLPVTLPFLCLQPLVENAVRHGLSRKPGMGTISIVARDAGAECHITVEDDGVGMDPAVLLSADDTTDAGQHVGLRNVDERLRSVFGDGFGVVVETAPDAGTKVSMRVPKFHPGVRSSQ
jgi:two-component system, LytTR family, sensor kinase